MVVRDGEVADVGLSIYGDPDQLDALAARLAAKAAQVRHHAADHVRQGEAARWVSTAAQAYRGQVAKDRADADGAAELMEHAAAALRVHAQNVREMLALIAEYEREVSAWFEQQARSLADGVDRVVDTAGWLFEKVVDKAPWIGGPMGVDSFSLPAPGDMKWLEVGRFMRNQGAI